MPSAQPMRADAQRNYDALVAVARRHLTGRGVTTSLEAIAREAGVGVGTLYRHFPDRDHLIFAALNAQGEQLRSASVQIRKSTPEATQLELWLAEVEKYLSSYQGLPDSIVNALECDDKSPLAITCQEIIALTEDYLAVAKTFGSVRADVSGQTLFEATLMIAWLNSQIPDQSRSLENVRELLRRGYLT